MRGAEIAFSCSLSVLAIQNQQMLFHIRQQFSGLIKKCLVKALIPCSRNPLL